MYEYEVELHWSEDDGVFVAEAPELPGCMAHGETEEAAREQIGQAMDLWIDTAREFGDPIPEPKVGRLAPWAGPDSPIGRYIRDETARTLDAYRSQPSLVDEQANQEQDKARGGYADRQIVELVQNAGDQLTCSGDRIKICLTRTHLYVADDGSSIDEEGARALMFSHLSPKRGTEEIGRFGVGFKSVLAVTDVPSIFSRSGSFIFDRAWAASLIRRVAPDARDYPVLRVAKPVDPRVEASGDPILASFMQWAVNIVRLRLKDDADDKIAEQIRAFDAAFLLFVPHVKRLDMVSDDDTVPDRALRLQESEGQYKLEDGSESSWWKVFRRRHRLSASAQGDRRALDDAEDVDVTWAASLDPQSRHHHFWAYFPTQTHSLARGIFNAPWKTNEDRQNLLTGPYNDDLIDAAVLLVADSITDLSTQENPAQHLDALGGRVDGDLNAHASRLANAVYSELRARAVIPDQDGALRRLDEVSIPPDLGRIDPKVRSVIADLWGEYQHRPATWLHESAVTQDRLAAIGRICRGSGVRSYEQVPRSSVAEWLEALTDAGRAAGDEVTASRTAIAIAALLPKDKGPAGSIVLTADNGWAVPGPDTVYLSDAEGVDVSQCVHPAIESDPETLRALKKLGVSPLTPEVEFKRLARNVLQPRRSYAPYVRTHDHVDQGESWREFWRVARSIDEQSAIGIIDDTIEVDRTMSRRDVEVQTLAGEWRPIRDTLLPGRVVPDDGSRDDRITVDLTFHTVDLDMLKKLGARTEPTGGYDDFERCYRPYEQAYLDRCKQEYRKRDLPRNPQKYKLNFKNLPRIGPLDAFRFLSDEGRCRATEVLLLLDETFEPWVMHHSTQTEYPDVQFRSLVIELLCEYGRVRTSTGIRGLSDGLGESPENREVQRWLLAHPTTRRIRRAFPNLSAVSAVSVQPVGDDEPTPITDEWPGLDEHLSADARMVDVVRCDGLVGEDGQDAATDCARVGNDIYLVRGDEERELRAVVDELGLKIDQYRFGRILRRETREDVRVERQKIAERSTDAERLLAAVGEENLLQRLPHGLIRILRQAPQPFIDVRVADAAIAVYHVGALHEYRDSLQRLDPPEQWAGSPRAITFVQELGFDVEWAGRRSPKRPPHEEVSGPHRLPPLHGYQRTAVAKVRALLGAPSAGGEKRGLLSLPTGSGKTRVAVEAIIDAIREDGFAGTVLWVADRDELCEQAVESWRHAWSAIGPETSRLRISRMWGGQRRPVAADAAHVIVATRQTLAAQGISGESADDPLNDVRLLVVDEAHGSIAPSYTSIMGALGLTFRRGEDEICLLGLTATPYRGRNEEETERLVNRYGQNRLDREAFRSEAAQDVIQELQGMNVLAVADHDTIQGSEERLEDDELRSITESNLPWLPESVERRIANSAERTRRIIEAYRSRIWSVDPTWPTLIFATSVEHAETIAALLQLEGIEARAVSYKTSATVRRSVVEQFRNGEVRVLVNYGVFREGFDAPKTRALIVARPVYSPNLYFQMIGRGLRGELNGGSDRCLILDVEDNIENYDKALAFSELDWLWTDPE